MNEQNKKVPTVRFKGFTNDWEQRKLGDIGKSTGGTSIESEFSPYGPYKVINIGSYSEDHSYNDQGIRAVNSDKTQKRILNKYDLTMILNDKTSTGKIIGSVLIIPCDNEYVYNQRTERIEPNANRFSSLFLYHYLNAPIIRKKIISNAQGNTQLYVNWSSISKLNYYIPNLSEQNKIGDFLDKVSKAITLQQRKLDLLKQLKKGFLQKMFAEKNSKQPALRFKGFHDDWEQRKLGEDILLIHTGTNILGSDTNDGIPLLKMGNLRNGYFDFSKLEYLPRNIDIDEQDIIKYGDFLFNTRNTLELVGKGATWTMESKKFAFNGNIARFDLKSDIDTIFFNYLYNTSIIMRQIHARATGTTSVAAIYPNTLNNLIYRLPIKDEQTKIGNFFKQLDSLISLHQGKQNHLKLLKKSLLQQMFM